MPDLYNGSWKKACPRCQTLNHILALKCKNPKCSHEWKDGDLLIFQQDDKEKVVFLHFRDRNHYVYRIEDFEAEEDKREVVVFT